VAGATILEMSDISSDRLEIVFRDHPAWGTIIVAVPDAKGLYRLTEPTDTAEAATTDAESC